MSDINIRAEKLVSDFLKQKESCLNLATEINQLINENYGGENTEKLTKEIFNDLRHVHNPYELKTLQASIDRIYLADIIKYIELFITEDEEIIVFGSYDDESGYYPDEMSCGPLRFNDEGEYIWIEEKVQEILQGSKDNFISFTEKFGLGNNEFYLDKLGSGEDESDYSHFSPLTLQLLGILPVDQEKSDLSATSEENLNSAISEVCEFFSELVRNNSIIGTSSELVDLFFITSNSCYNAPLKSDRESFSISWIMNRTGFS